MIPPVPRFEIGTYFVTIYHCDKRTRSEDSGEADAAAKKLQTCLGEERPMFINMYHPSSPTENAAESAHPGTKDEVHDGEVGRYAHHVELIKAQRDIAFTDNEMSRAIEPHTSPPSQRLCRPGPWASQTTAPDRSTASRR